MGFPRRLSQTEIQGSHRNLPKACANPSRYIRTYQRHITHALMVNRNVPISGWNNTFGSGATKGKTTGTSGSLLQNTPTIFGQVKPPANPRLISSWDLRCNWRPWTNLEQCHQWKND